MTDNRALWELVEKWLTEVRNCPGETDTECSWINGVSGCADELAAILERPVVVGDSRAVAEVADINGASMCAVIDIKTPNVLVVGDKLYLQPLESMARGKS